MESRESRETEATLRKLTEELVADISSLSTRINEDAAMLLVGDCLAAAGSPASCTRNEIRGAFEYLTNPRVGAAVWADGNRDVIVILKDE